MNQIESRPPTQLEQDISFVLSQWNKEKKATEDPFMKRILFNRENCSKTEHDLYNWIYKNWFWCINVTKWKLQTHRWRAFVSHYNTADIIGYRMVDKNKVLELFKQ